MDHVNPGDGAPGRERLDRWQRARTPRTNEVPVAAAVSVLLAGTDNAAVALVGARTGSTGVTFDLALRVRSVPAGIRASDLQRALSGHGRPEPGAPDLRLLLGVEYADGRTADNLGGPFAGLADDDAERPVLRSDGGSSGGGPRGGFVLDGRFWLSPVPPDGPVTVVVAWPALGVPETRHELADVAFTSDSERVVVLWPEPEADPPVPAAPPAVPSGSWFADRGR